MHKKDAWRNALDLALELLLRRHASTPIAHPVLRQDAWRNAPDPVLQELMVRRHAFAPIVHPVNRQDAWRDALGHATIKEKLHPRVQPPVLKLAADLPERVRLAAP